MTNQDQIDIDWKLYRKMQMQDYRNQKIKNKHALPTKCKRSHEKGSEKASTPSKR